jgi:hypothetical protein
VVDRRWSSTVAARGAARTVVAAAVAVGLAAIPAVVSLVAPAQARAAPLRDCTATHGTIVAIVRGCGIGEKTGYALLHAAGFTTAGDAHDGPAFICRLGDAAFAGGRQYPTPQQQACVQTPPDSAHWSYWLAGPDAQHWSTSQLGAMSEIPRPGEVQLWTFGATNATGTSGSAVPSVTPASLRAAAPVSRATTGRHTATRTTTTRTTNGARGSSSATTTNTSRATTTTRATTATPRTATSPHARTRTSAATSATATGRTTTTARSTAAASTTRTRQATTATTRTATTRARTAHAHPARSTATTTTHRAATEGAAAPPTTSSTTDGAQRVVAARPTSQRASSGSATPLIVGAALVALLGAGAVRTLRARRRQE